ncbi:MAG: DEAD/DEAH box helicase family protein [Gammaproteobacteria bacterium]|nr:DEAD/DEAH box helicase family protein [Gammaproteobacteria bacterium]
MRAFLEELNQQRLRSYDADPGLLKEHFGIEETVLAGGYGYRQVLELVQNGADALLEASEHGGKGGNQGRIHVLVRGHQLYVANTGARLSEEGLDALLRSHSSPKRGNQIGRFGLGFKSLLKLGGRIDLFTRGSGTIRFDPERCRRELRQRYRVTDAPRLRLAWSLGDEERHADPACAELDWAETIVRAEIGEGDLAQQIREEIRSFPAEFLLFFPVTTTLILDDGEKKPREVRIESEADESLLHDGENLSRWRVAAREVRIEDARARADATHIHARAIVPIAWAVPVQGRREEAGRFWAFFPTHTQTYVPGILNAPWKLNSDRNAVIGGEWNTALMAEAAGLIVEALPDLATADDPGRPLDAFPRQLERKDEDAAPLVESLWRLLERAAVIADAVGRMHPPHALWRHPNDGVDLVASWQSLAGADRRSLFIHPSCLERQRPSRLSALAERLERSEDEGAPPALRRSSAEHWFGCVAGTEIRQALAVLRLAEDFSKACQWYEWSRVRPHLPIIPSQSKKLVTPIEAVIAPDGVRVPGRVCVAAALLGDSEARRVLTDVLHVNELDEDVWTEILDGALNVPGYPRDANDGAWRTFWSRLRRAPAGVRRDFLAENGDRIRVRRRDGQWVVAGRVLLPGLLVTTADGSPNSNVLVDDLIHAKDRSSLLDLGVSAMPQGDMGPEAYARLPAAKELLRAWRNACRNLYKREHKVPARWDYLEPGSLTMPTGYSLLTELVGSAKARWTVELLNRSHQPAYSKKTVDFGHSTMAVYPRMRVPHPLPWYLREHGVIEIGATVVRLAALVAKQDEPILVELPDWDRISPLREHREVVFPDVTVTKADVRCFWVALIEVLATAEALATDSLTALWSGAAKDDVVPIELPSDAGPIPIRSVFVSGSMDLTRRARAEGLFVVALDDLTLQKWLQAGAKDLLGVVDADWAAAAGMPERLLNVLPDFGDVLNDEARHAARCQFVIELALRIGETTQPVPCLMSNEVLRIDSEQLASLSRVDRFLLLLTEISAAGWLNRPVDEALRFLGDAHVDARRAYVAAGETLAERLLRAVGGRSEPLRDALGDRVGTLDCVLDCTPLKIAELVLSHLGPAALSVLRDTLESEGLMPPGRWNTSAAHVFVASIGFPPEFAASAQARRGPEELVSGPIELPPLHDFQEEVFHGLRTLFVSGGGRRRAVVSLPTGGGKTRVTVEAAVKLVLAPERANRCVVWIAQTDELCEQAVQAFRQVWVNLGAQRTNLRVVRLWGGNPDPAPQGLDTPVVVVASIQTLNNRFGAMALDWLRKPGLVVVDECHHAITPSYSSLLRWLDAETTQREMPNRSEPAIVGLSATPFRTDDVESQRLARRFDSRWLPSDQARLYSRLRCQGVLAEARYEPLDSGVSLTDEELASLGGLDEEWEGLDFENVLEAINQRLADDTERNQRLLDFIAASGERSTLFFANSVAHAEQIAARLNIAGIGAAAISGSTPRVARRYFLDRFQRGDIRVLCNHSVLTTGFDSPKTDMILIARQVFSPVRYMQMVGRGLRGEKNGGTSSCRIVTVIDNLGRFEGRHPYHYCRRYFLEMESNSAAIEASL